MDGHRVLLTPHGHIENAGAGHGDRPFFVRRPVDRVAEQPAMIERQHLPEHAIDVPREIDDAASADLADIHFRDVGLGHPRVDLLHRQIRVRRNQRQRH